MTGAVEAPKGVLVLDVPNPAGRALLEMVQGVGLEAETVDSLDGLIAAIVRTRAPVGLVAFETLWPNPQDAVRRIRDQARTIRLVVIHSEGTQRLHLGQRLWAVGLIDYFAPRSTPPQEMGPLIRQAYADAVIELAAQESQGELGQPSDHAESLRFVHELSRGLNNQRRTEDLLRLLHRKLPYLLDYSVLQVLVAEPPICRLHVFPTFRVPHDAVWKLATDTCAAVQPLYDERLAPETLDIIENAPFAATGDGDAPAGKGESQTLALPMVIHGKLVGCLSLLLPGGVSLTREQAAFLQLITGQLGAAIRNAQALREAEDASQIDELTGLYNRRFLNRFLPTEWRRVVRYKTRLTVAMIDIDRFKQVNDQYGHLVGDAVLRNMAQALRHYLRDTDYLVRFGGEEFLAILPETGPSEAAIVMERLRLALKREPLYTSADVGSVQVSCSAGVAGYPVCAVATIEDLITQADNALLAAKRSGRDRVCVAAGSSVQNLEDRPEDIAPSAQDRRRFPRINTGFPVRYIELPDFESHLVSASTIDVSAGGMAVADPSRRLKTHTYALVFVEDGRSPVLSRVVWSKDSDGGRTAGLQFVERQQVHADPPKRAPRAMVIAQQRRTIAMIERVLTAARYEMDVVSSEAQLTSGHELSRYSLVVIGESALRTWVGDRLAEIRSGMNDLGRIVVINEQPDRNAALRTIGDQKVEHLVPLDDTADQALFTTLNKLLIGEYFGIRRYLLWGATNPDSWTLTQRDQKGIVLDGIRRIAEEVRCHPRVGDLLIAAVDEMLVNALYHPSGDATSPRSPVTVECGTDGRLLAVSVLDNQGTFRQEDLYRGLGIALQREKEGLPDDAKSASIGFRIMLSCLSQLAINVEPGRRTEVIGIVDLRKSLREYRQAVPVLGVFSKDAEPKK
jgi:diguanylate cyclase (GGDEF)-like protein